MSESTPKFAAPAQAARAFTRHLLPADVEHDIAPGDVYTPVNDYQVSNLTGRLLTVVDMLGLQGPQAKAIKDVVRTTIRGWHSEALDNADTSYRGCIAPLVMLRHANGTERKVIWLAEGDHAVTVS